MLLKEEIGNPRGSSEQSSYHIAAASIRIFLLLLLGDGCAHVVGRCESHATSSSDVTGSSSGKHG